MPVDTEPFDVNSIIDFIYSDYKKAKEMQVKLKFIYL